MIGKNKLFNFCELESDENFFKQEIKLNKKIKESINYKIDENLYKEVGLVYKTLEDFNQDTYQDMLMLSSDINALTLVSGEDSGVEGVENAMRHIPSEMQVFAMVPMSKTGQYTGNVLVSGWDGKENSTYIIQLGKISDRLDQGYLITPDFISNRLSNLLSNVQDDEPAIPEVYIEVIPDYLLEIQLHSIKRLVMALLVSFLLAHSH